jgi:hypothetical protein
MKALVSLQMTSRIDHTTIDCHDAYALSTFWAQVLGFTDVPGDANEPGHEAGRRRPSMSGALRAFVSFALAAAGAVALAQPAAAAGDTCSYDPSTKVVTVVFPAANVGRLISRAHRGTKIEYEGAPCSTATVKNTKRIDVTAGSGAQNLTIDLLDGPFAPGSAPSHSVRARSNGT